MPSNSPFINNLHPLYTIYFLYLEPFFALGGTYLSIWNPERLLKGIVPLPAYTTFATSAPDPVSPVITLLLTNIGSLYFLFALNEALLLRISKEKKVWLTVVAGMLMSDTGHLYATWKIDPERALQLLAWTSDEWINYGTLVLGMLLRLAFVAGIGRN